MADVTAGERGGKVESFPCGLVGNRASLLRRAGRRRFEIPFDALLNLLQRR
ncbi:hypothetical protein WKW52_33740 [Bradyrhizobium ottawaense]|uniref:hypothetical protein n=1 Tax=Bradyrhizobium ottawaense TaxID=931866 RepID=UPI00313E2ADF